MNLDQKSSTNQRPDFNGPSSFKRNLSTRQNLRDLSHKIAFLVYMNSDHFRVHLSVGLYFHMNDEFTRPPETSRPRPIELNDQNNVHIEMDPTEVNQVDPNVYIGDETDENCNPKKN